MNILPETGDTTATPPLPGYMAWFDRLLPGPIQVGRILTWLPWNKCDLLPVVARYPDGRIGGVDLCRNDGYVGTTPDQALKAAEEAAHQLGRRP